MLADPENNVLTFEERFCTVCAGSDRQARRIAAIDRDWDRRHQDPDQHAPLKAHLADARVPRPGDGRHLYLRRVHPDEINHAHTKGDGPKEA